MTGRRRIDVAACGAPRGGGLPGGASRLHPPWLRAGGAVCGAQHGRRGGGRGDVRTLTLTRTRTLTVTVTVTLTLTLTLTLARSRRCAQRRRTRR